MSESDFEEPAPAPVFVDQSGTRGRLLRGLGWPVSVVGAILAVAMGSSLVGVQADAPAMGIPAQPSLAPAPSPSPVPSLSPTSSSPSSSPRTAATKSATPKSAETKTPAGTPKPSAGTQGTSTGTSTGTSKTTTGTSKTTNTAPRGATPTGQPGKRS